MKKYILGAITLVMVIVGSAFVKGNHDSKDTLYHWYNVDANGFVVSGSEAFMGTPETVSYASSNLPCTPGTNKDCIRGFSTIPSFPTSASGDTAPLKKQ
jgi:hypothetical protein